MQHLILLHGALGAAEQFNELSDELQPYFRTHTIDLFLHGKNEETEKEFSIPAFAAQVIEYLNTEAIPSIHVFGYSMGGYIALYLARHFPERVQKIITLASKFNWSPTIAQQEIKMLNPDTISLKVPEFASLLKLRHGEHKWKLVLQNTANLMLTLGEEEYLKDNDFENIHHPTLIGLGDSDKMVSLNESQNVVKHIKNASFYTLPHTKHPFESVDTKTLAATIRNFIQQ